MNNLSALEMQEIEEHLREGSKIAAIKAYVDATGVGLREAKEAVENMQRDLPMDSTRDVVQPKAGQSMPESAAAEITEALFAGEKIHAVKVYREAMGGGLKDAKHAVDALESDLRRECPGKFHFAAKQGCLGLLLFGGLVAGLIGYISG